MPHVSRVVCLGCGAQLGALNNGRLSVEGHRVDIDRRGIVMITCTTCKTARCWEPRKSA